MRLALEIGVHRRKPVGYKMTAEDELMKRCFWSESPIYSQSLLIIRQVYALPRPVDIYYAGPTFLVSRRRVGFFYFSPTVSDDRYLALT